MLIHIYRALRGLFYLAFYLATRRAASGSKHYLVTALVPLFSRMHAARIPPASLEPAGVGALEWHSRGCERSAIRYSAACIGKAFISACIGKAVIGRLSNHYTVGSLSWSNNNRSI